MRHRFGLPAAVVALSFGALAFGQPAAWAAGPPSLMGSYQLDRAQSDSVSEAVERSLADLNPLLRLVVRRAIQSVKLVHEGLTLSQSGPTLSLVWAGSPPMTGPVDGSAFGWTREDGAKVALSFKWEGRNLVQSYAPESREPKRVSTFSLRPDGKSLKVAVRFLSEGRGKALAYNLVYLRR